MKTRQISYERTRQVRPYEPVRVGIVVELDADDTEEDALQHARDFVNTALAQEI